MLLSILEVLKNVLSKYEKLNLSEEDINRLSEIFEHYPNDIIPVSIVKGELKLSYDQANDLMVYLAINNLLQINYKVWCDNTYLDNGGKIYKHITEVPKEVCGRCDKECQVLNNVIIVFRNILTT
jgi:hypothetical protein